MWLETVMRFVAASQPEMIGFWGVVDQKGGMRQKVEEPKLVDFDAHSQNRTDDLVITSDTLYH